MGRKQGESHREFKKRMIDPVSESFCAAKWLNATIWLGHGGTTSCHHPPAHQIDLEEIKTKSDALNEVAQAIATKAYQQAQEAQQQDDTTANSNVDDGVVDAEFEEVD